MNQTLTQTTWNPWESIEPVAKPSNYLKDKLDIDIDNMETPMRIHRASGKA